MANFGVSDLRLVTPEADSRSPEARALASHGESVLEGARMFPSLVEALADCVWAGATSARLGGLFRKQNVLPVKAGLAEGMRLSAGKRIALVFGPEDHGLLNEEISLCHHLLHIPAHPEYDVLNLAQSVVICLYEWFQATSDKLPNGHEEAPVSAGDLAKALDHLEEALRAVHFIWGEKGDSVAHALRHLLGRSMPNELENKLLHGLARQLLWYVKHHQPTDGKK